MPETGHKDLRYLIDAHRATIAHPTAKRKFRTDAVADRVAVPSEGERVWLQLLAYRPKTRGDALQKLCYISAVVMTTKANFDSETLATLIESVSRAYSRNLGDSTTTSSLA